MEQKVRLLGYYTSADQTMAAETEKVEEANELAPLFEESIRSLYLNPNTDEKIKNAISSKTVFVFKSETGNLYAYFTVDKTVRITGVQYNKAHIIQVSYDYKSWFYPGQRINVKKILGETGEIVSKEVQRGAGSRRENVGNIEPETPLGSRGSKRISTEDVSKIKHHLRLKDDFFIGQFIPVTGGYKIVDIRNSEFTKIEDTERNIRDLVIYYRTEQQNLYKYAYYKFTWTFLGYNPLKFGIDTSKELEYQSPEDIIGCIAHSLENYSMDAARKITRNLDTLSKQLTQSGKEVFIYELLQNANDYPQKRKDGDDLISIPVDVEFHILDDFLTFQHTGEYFNAKNVAAICNINDGEKNANKEAIGYKGIGFKTVFLDNDYVFLQTGTYSFRFDKKAGTSEAVPINTPWQIYPFWTPIETVSDSIIQAFKQHPKEEYRVKFALRPRNSRILTDRTRKDNYIDLFNKVFETERVILFIPNIHQVNIFIGNSNTPAITCSKDNDSWCVSEALIEEVPEEIRERINDVLTNNDADKSDGYDKIPEKYYNFNKTAIKFACKKDGRKLRPVENACLYCYLPAKRANWGFDFLMNTDMVPNGYRDNIEDIELNHVIARIAGRQFFYWIKSLIESEEYDLDSVFSLIPDFGDCKEKHEEYDTFIEEFQEEFEELIKEESFVPVVDKKGKEYFTTIDNIINDMTGLTKDGVMSDNEFLSVMDVEDNFLPVKELRASEAFMDFLYKYSPSELDINFDDVKRKCSNNEFVIWLSNIDNNNRFLYHLIVNHELVSFSSEKIFIEFEGELFKADELYYEIESYCKDILFLRNYIPHLKDATRDYFKENEEWRVFYEQHFMSFNVKEMLDEYIFGCDDAMKLLEEMDNSKSFFKFISENNVDLSEHIGDLPYIDEDGVVCNEFDGLLYFYSESSFNLSKASWLGDNSITILSHEYLEDDSDDKIKKVFQNLGFRDFEDKDFIIDHLVGDSDFRDEINSVIEDDYDVNLSFLKYVFSVRDHLKEKEGQLKDYVLKCQYVDGDEVYLSADDVRYFSQDSYAGNSTFVENSEHLWLPITSMYSLDNCYFEAFPQEERKQLESFLRQSFGIKTFTNKSFFFDVVIANKKEIYEKLNSQDILEEFIAYLKRDEKDIFDDTLSFNDIKDMPLLIYDGTIITKRDASRLVEYDDEAIFLANKKWFPSGVFVVMSSLYSDFQKSTLQLLKIEKFNLPEVIKEGIVNDDFPLSVAIKENNIDFWQYIRKNLKAFESLDIFKKIKLVAEGEDNTQLYSHELYISDIYQVGGIETLVKKYDETANFISVEYLEEDNEPNRQEWLRFFKKLGLRFDNKDILFNSVLPKLAEIEEDSVIAMMTMHLKDIKEEWDKRRSQIIQLKVRTRSGQFRRLDEAIIINIDETNVVEPFKEIELKGEIAPEILSANKDIIYLIAAEFSKNCTYTTKEEWAQAKINEYIDSIQPDETLRESLHIDFIRELATLMSNDYSFSKVSLSKLLYKSKNSEDGYLPSVSLTLGTNYKPSCDFEANGITELNYLSEEYLTENNKDTIRAFFKNTDIHQTFEIDEQNDIDLLSNRVFALYFWGKYFTHRLAEFKEWIEEGKFDNVICIPTEGSVVASEELYSPEIFHFARNTPEWQKKVPAKTVVDNVREESARRIFLSLPFRMSLNFADCFNYLLTAKEKYGEDYKNRSTIVDWILEADERDDSIIDWYREQPNATWRNGKGQFTHIKDLYVIHPDAKQERNIFIGNEHVMNTSMFPVGKEDFEEICQILRVQCLLSSDFKTTPVNPKDETIEIMKALMPKILILAAIEKPDKYQIVYEKYVEEIKKYRFLVCDKIDLGYESIHNDIERIYTDEGHFYYVNSWLHNRTYTKFCSKLRNLLNIEVYADVCEDVLDSSVSVETCIEKYCSSLVYDESFRRYLKELDHEIANFEEEYIPEEEVDYYSDTIADGETVQNEEESDIEEYVEKENASSLQSDKGQYASGVKSQENQPEEPINDETNEEKNIIYDKVGIEEPCSSTRVSVPENTDGEDMEDEIISSEVEEDREISEKEQTTGVEGHHRDGCWVNEYWREDGTHVVGHWRSDTVVSPYTKEVSTEHETREVYDHEMGAEQKPALQHHEIVRTHDEEEVHDDFLGSVDKDEDYNKLGEKPRKPKPRKVAKPFTPEEIERMRSHGTPLELESLPPTTEEIEILSQCGISPEQIADHNYLAQLRLYNNLKNVMGEEPEESLEEFIHNSEDVTVHRLRGGKYIHACNAARGVMYVSPSVWNKMLDDKWTICVYLNGQGSKFEYINNKEEFLRLVEKDDVVIKITGKEKVKVVNELYSETLRTAKGTAYTLIRVAARTNMDAVFAHYVGAMAEKEDGYDYSDDL